MTERFHEFNGFHKKTGSEIAEMIENVLHDQGIDRVMTTGQTCQGTSKEPKY